VAGGALLAYIVHRNARVTPDARVLSLGHAKRLVSKEGKKSTTEKGMRVQLAGADGKKVGLPEDMNEAKDYDAVQDFLYDILWRRAEAVDVVAGKEGYRVVYAIDGVPSENQETLKPEDGERVFRYLKRLAGLNVEEIRRPQVGKIKCSLLSQAGDAGETEVRTSGTTAGERLSLRVRTGPTLMRLPDLGMAEQRLEATKGFLGKSHGLVLISAPSKHGLTTTQYAILKTHDAYTNNIHALEREKLLDLDNVTQQVFEGSNKDVNFARMLQSILRREPDIVMVDNCEDHETALVASRAAADDRKIYMGIQAKDTFDALGKYVGLLGDNPMAAKALLGVINQRLIRLLCTDCREAFKPDAATLKKLNLPAEKIERFYRPPTEQKLDRKGRPILCTTCRGTGYVGRTGVFEVLVVDPSIAELIKEGAPINRIKAQCRKNKMYYLQEEGLLKVIDGATSMNEVLRCLGSGNPQDKS
jgi:type II secretory ATPase GspE/PulE/Tfp pilus assembly ATPase PilB-like protein